MFVLINSPFFPEDEFTADVFLRLLIYCLETNLFIFYLLYFLLERKSAPRAGHKLKTQKHERPRASSHDERNRSGW